MNIPILFAADINYVKYLYVAILSLLDNKKETTNYKIYVLSPKKYPLEFIKDFNELISKYNGVSIQYVDMGEEIIDVKGCLPDSTYYYLKIAEIISDYDKAIYLDPDIIILDDLTELYNVNLGTNYVAGVKAACYMLDDNSLKEYYDSIGLYDRSQYINANSLVFNLKLLRENNVTNKFCDLIKNNYNSQDQDILNLVCYNKIVHIPFKYNVMVKYLPYSSYEFLENIYGEENLTDAQNSPVIIHYANYKQKPWCYDTELSSYWWKYAKKTPYYRTFLINYFISAKLINSVVELTRSIFSITNELNENQKYKILRLLGLKFTLKKYQ